MQRGGQLGDRRVGNGFEIVIRDRIKQQKGKELVRTGVGAVMEKKFPCRLVFQPPGTRKIKWPAFVKPALPLPADIVGVVMRLKIKPRNGPRHPPKKRL